MIQSQLDRLLQRKKLRVALLCVLLLIAVLWWQIQFRSAPTSSRLSGAPSISSFGAKFGVEPLSPGFSLSGGPAGYRSPLADYPKPSTFKTFSYGLGMYSDKTSLSVSGLCADTYYVVLIFNAEVDYREQANMAVYNSAQPCKSGERFSTEINLDKAVSARPGRYYYFVADQGKTGLWRNPR
jgi:hypothetical protein